LIDLQIHPYRTHNKYNQPCLPNTKRQVTYVFHQEITPKTSTQQRSNKPTIHFPVADLPSIHQTDHDVRTTNPDHSTLACNNETQKNPTGTGIDSMLGSTILAAANDSSDSQAHDTATANTTSTSNSSSRRWFLILKRLLLTFYLILKGLLLLFYLILWAWVLMVLYAI
jgi:hypothetical protein